MVHALWRWFSFFISKDYGENMGAFNKLKKLKTLLVDDDELIRDSLNTAFEAKGCFMRAVETAEEALKVLKTEHFDIIISDFRLPGTDGLQFFKRANISLKDTITVLVTAYRDKDISSAAAKIGIHDFIEKPFAIVTLIESLAGLVESRQDL